MPAKPDYMSDADWNSLDADAQARVAAHAGAGGSNVWKPGDRISRADWDRMSQAEKNAIGLGTFDDYKAAHRAYQARWNPETGDIGQERRRIAEGAYASGALNDPNSFFSYLASQGHGPDSPWYKQLQMAAQGTADPTGSWHRTPEGWINVATSDLTAKDKPTWSPPFQPQTGMAAILGDPAIGGVASWADRLAQWFNAGTTSMEGRTPDGGYYNTHPDGTVDYFDMFGRPTGTGVGAPQAGQAATSGSASQFPTMSGQTSQPAPGAAPQAVTPGAFAQPVVNPSQAVPGSDSAVMAQPVTLGDIAGAGAAADLSGASLMGLGSKPPSEPWQPPGSPTPAAPPEKEYPSDPWQPWETPPRRQPGPWEPRQPVTGGTFRTVQQIQDQQPFTLGRLFNRERWR